MERINEFAGWIATPLIIVGVIAGLLFPRAITECAINLCGRTRLCRQPRKNWRKPLVG